MDAGHIRLIGGPIMKKLFRTMLLAALCTVLALPVSARAAEGVSMDNVSLNVGESETITPVFDGGFTFTYDSSDEAVAVVDTAGTVTGVGEGVCYVTARCWYGETLVGSTAVLITVGTGAGTAVHYDRELVLTKTPVGNTGAVIAVSGAVGTLTAESSNADIASVRVDGEAGTVTVTGAEGAVGVVTVTVSDGTLTNAVEVPVGYTTFVFDGTDVTVIGGSDGNYEIAAITAALENEMVVASAETDADGNPVYAVPEDYTALQVAVKKTGGTYVFRGTGTDGAIAVKKAASKDAVLLLDGLDLTSSFTSPVTVKKDSTAAVTLTALLGTVNTLADSAFNNADTYGAESDGGDGTNSYYAESAVIKYKAGSNVILNGGGTLNLNANAKNGIKAANLLTVEGLSLQIAAPDNGISGENSIDLRGADITVTTGAGDAIKCEDDTETIGAITITGGTLDLTAGRAGDGANAEGDGIQATTALTIYGGAFTVTAGGGTANTAYLAVQSAGKGDNASQSAQAAAAALKSCKGLKSGGELTIYDGTFTVDAADDSLHADTNLTIYGGSFAITSGDDGVHAEYVLSLGITGASNDALTMTIGSESASGCYEGLEGAAIYVYSGTYAIYATDDAVNAANGDLSNYTYSVEIDGGVLKACSSGGDGLDSNGNMVICAGAAVQVYAPNGGNAALDYGDKQSDTMSFGFTAGGSVLAVGSSNMATTPDNGLYVAFGGRSSGGGGGQWPGGP